MEEIARNLRKTLTGNPLLTVEAMDSHIESALIEAQSELARAVLSELNTCDNKAVNSWIRCYLQGNLLALFSRLHIETGE